MKNNEPQVLLRCIENRDAQLLMELNNDPEIAEFVVGNPRIVTLEEQLQWMERVKSEHNTKRFVVECDSLAVGTIIISDIDYSNLTANLNIKLHKLSRGKGIGKQSIKKALEYCFEDMDLSCVTAHVLPYNKSSIALFESCCFTNEGLLRSRVIKGDKRFDLISFSITKDEFQQVIRT